MIQYSSNRTKEPRNDERTYVMEDEKLMSVPEVANILGVKPATVYALCNREKLEHVRVGRKIRITGKALRRFVDTGGAQTGGQQ